MPQRYACRENWTARMDLLELKAGVLQVLYEQPMSPASTPLHLIGQRLER